MVDPNITVLVASIKDLSFVLLRRVGSSSNLGEHPKLTENSTACYSARQSNAILLSESVKEINLA
jgi:hypothetical protein